MKNKFFKGTLCCFTVVLLLIGILPVSVAADQQSVEKAQSFLDGVVTDQAGGTSTSAIQQWINGSLSQNAGAAEWYAIGLSQYGEYDFSSYEASLLSYLSENEVASASSRQKYALALIAAGSTDSYIDRTLKDSFGEQGVMSWVFALHLLNNGYSSDGHSVSSVKEKLLSLQLADGGWAIMGETGDVDVTAMAIQALAPYYESDASVESAVDRALTLLADCQQAAGDYESYGIGNPESTAQVLIALSALGIDCQTDNRFIKNGHTLFDGIGKYRLSDGTFSHQQGEEYSDTATAQVFCAMISYLRMVDGRGSLYVLDGRNPSGLKVPVADTSEETVSENQQGNSGGYQLWACLTIVILAGGICLLLFLLKKRNGRNFLVILIIAAAAVIFVLTTDFQTTDSYYENAEAVKENAVGTVTMTIRCDTIVNKREEEYIPADGIILDATEFAIDEDDTVYDILKEATAKNKIQLETNGSGEAVYVEGINHIYEFDFGDLSGWVYYVNAEESSTSCGAYELSDGDQIEWFYTCELGKDLR